eukprot:c14861_g1_i1 orf=270-1043(+)
MALPSSRRAIWRTGVGQFCFHLFQGGYSLPSRHLCTSATARNTLNSVQMYPWRDQTPNWSVLCERQLQVAFKFYSTRSSERHQAKQETTQKDLAAQDEDPFDSLTDKIPQKPVTIVEGASYSLIILFGFAVAGFAAYGVFKELLFEPKEYKVFNKALSRVQSDNQVTVRIGTPITGYGQDTRNRAARQHIPHRAWVDEDGVQRIEVQFYVRGPHGIGRVHSEMFKDTVDKQWKFTYLIVDILSPSPTRLMLESYVPA